jgi:DNA-binding NarL/FixJ family response regulator
MPTIRLALVDDHKLFLEGMVAVLSKEIDIEVVDFFNSAKEALSKLDFEDIDLLITDISMPEMNGLEFVNQVNKKNPNLKILVISMFQQIEPFKGIDGYLLKETSFENLIDAIKQIVFHNKTCFYSNYEKPQTAPLDFKKTIITTREKEIIQLISEEYSTTDIAEKLFLSKHTIETHKKNIFLKLQVHNAAGLIKKAAYLGYL